MAKLKSIFAQETQERIRLLNGNEITNAFKNAGCQEIPANVKVFLENLTLPRIQNAVLSTYADIIALEGAQYFGEVKDDSIFAATLKRDETSFPTLYIFSPEHAAKVLKLNNLKTIRLRLRKKYNCALPEKFETLIMEKLPDELPEKILFEGCEARFAKLRDYPSNVVYDEDMVEHKVQQKKAWTFFIPNADYKYEFTWRLVNQFGIKKDLAQQISETWSHDTYVSLADGVETDFRQYAAMVVFGLTEGAVVNDILQGECEVICHTDERGTKLYLDIDNELPSAVICDHKMYVYVPPKTE